MPAANSSVNRAASTASGRDAIAANNYGTNTRDATTERTHSSPRTLNPSISRLRGLLLFSRSLCPGFSNGASNAMF